MAKILSKSIKVSERRNAKRLSGKAGLRIIKRGVKILRKKYNRKNINARKNTIKSSKNTIKSSNATTNSSDATKTRTLETILNDDSFIAAIPDDWDPDYEIPVRKDYYDFTYQPKVEESELSISEDNELSHPNEEELNAIFDGPINELMKSITDFPPN